MRDKKLFEGVHKNINKYEIRLDKYIIPSPRNFDKNKQSTKSYEIQDASEKSQQLTEENKSKEKTETPAEPEEEERLFREINILKAVKEKYATFAEQQKSEHPKICLWNYMLQPDVEHLLTLTQRQEIKKIIDTKMESDYPKGISRLLIIEMMYSIVRFCQKSKFNVKQVGALLSMFYLTHQYFLSCYYTTVEKTYKFFKEHMLLHCFDCPPDSMELFTYTESKHIILYFCTLYLRNLPLIRLLTLPNFGFYLHYELPPEIIEQPKGKGKKGKKGKK